MPTDKKVARSHRTGANKLFALCLLLISEFLALSTFAYDQPLSESSIREAYFLGTREGGLKSDFLAQYDRWIPQLKVGTCTSKASIETPFLQVAEYASKSLNYSAQDAVKDFYGKPAVFLLHLNICYLLNAPPNAIKVKIIQRKREIVPLSLHSSPYQEPSDTGYLLPNGEQISAELIPGKIASSDLTILIDTPNGQQAETEFDLRSLR